MEFVDYLGKENLDKFYEHAEKIDKITFQKFADLLDYNVGRAFKKEAKTTKESYITTSLIKLVLIEWYRICENQVKKRGFKRLCETLKNSNLHNLADGLVDPRKPIKRKITNPVRMGLTIANTYIGIKNVPPTQECEKSARMMSNVMKRWEFEMKINLNRTKKEVLEKDIPEFLEQVQQKDCTDIFVYFSGHGGYDTVGESDGQKESNGSKFFETEGMITEGGEYFIGYRKDKIFKSDIVTQILQGANPNSRKIFIFDCCRGDGKKELSSFKLEVVPSSLYHLTNSKFKNTYVFNTTLPYQVAFAAESQFTLFASEWFKQVNVINPADISKIDELINAELAKQPDNGFKQATELIKIGIDNPFYWYPLSSSVEITDHQSIQPNVKQTKRSIIMGNGSTMELEEFFEEYDWIDSEEKGAFQDEVNEVYEEFDEIPINFLTTFKPKDLTMRLFFSFITTDGRELVSRTKASTSNFKYKKDFYKDKSNIPECIICHRKYLMPNVYTFVYEHKDNDSIRTQMEYSDSMDQVCFIHFLEDGVDKGRQPFGQKKRKSN